MREKYLIFVTIWGIFFSTFASDSLSIKKPKNNFCKNVIGINYNNKSLNFILDSSIIQLCCDTLPQVQFWEKILELSPDSGVLNFAHNRQIIQTVHTKWWNNQSDDFKTCYRDSVRNCYQLPDTARVLFTTGKGHYYVWDSVFHLIDKAIQIFIENEVDPWYAQSVLLIESPKGNLRSPAGARGYFQLMKKVARKFGLKVNRHIDERLNFERSAYASAMLFKTICIPETKKMLDSLKISYNENDLWFKLLTMHVYHAGAYNVRNALMKSNCTYNDMRLIYCLWQTRTGAFQSASQNYSQLILTAYIKVYKKLDLLRCFRPQ
ncbi:MAG: hypothetical protein KatS3mg027_0888 [Bacteroidia bacterium]|nr:MAG: hypothetical protein KatS3mg027_0888 [Bacteroidia bacterium]